mmetsp:Transcript_14978/g.32939  ORF Transcript_14978/g.32939 Transcript_14978/m.32939 type:complete len:221 (-) Transcript_14978:119-781(-)|eukprot:CAMPEP_0170612260 /NCGR_PEP_ID=MMETSP0224-20130122/23628_1 /TAXON_ID=285029 /ORGANISM="Togula jolla, Strain CCCM 725" /LENGTH=220 /DNA_ID=CAMNT_0010937751 /DNA_START=55 /DNA_END=717 /DNA_ORIENTATION=+
MVELSGASVAMPRRRSASLTLIAIVALVAAAWASVSMTAFAAISNVKKSKIKVILTQDHPKLGKAGQEVMVKKGHFRNNLFPYELAVKPDRKVVEQMRREEARKRREADALMAESMELKKKIEETGTFIVQRKVREGSDKIYGSLTPTNMAEEIALKSGVPVRLASITLPKITELGEYNGSVQLTDDVSAYFSIKVVPEGWTAPEEGAEGEGEGEGEAEA